MNLSEPFIRRPVATSLLTAAVILSGVLAYAFLPVSPLPQIEFPTIQVTATLPGASPETMASSVATPLERQFGRISGVAEMTSTSYLGSTLIVLQFDLNRDIDGAARDVQAAINAARGQLPANLPNNPVWRKVNPADAPILILSLTSKTYDAARLYDAASTILQQKLAQLKGVGQVFVGGGSLPAVRIELHPTALAAMGLSLENVRTALVAANANRPKGILSDGERSWTLTASDQLYRAEEYAPLIIAYRGGSPVTLGDVASVRDSVEDIRQSGLANGKPAVLVILFRQPGANIIETIDVVRGELPRLKSTIPAEINVDVVLDRSTTIRDSVRDVELTLGLSVVLVVAVVFAFLRSVRGALIPSVAVPASLVGTLGVMYLAGYSIDNLSMMALAIATGFVVDDAIVVVENISRHRERGLPPMEAALVGAREIGFTVLSMSVSLVAVFIPILLMGGLVGRLFREFAVTLSTAIGVSLLVSLTTTPMMCAWILRARPEERPGGLARAGERAWGRIERAYRSALAAVLRHRLVTLFVTLGTVALTVVLFIAIPKGFFPQQDTGRLIGQILADQSTSFQAMSRLLAQFTAAVGKDPAVDQVIAFTGGGRGTTNTGLLYVALRPLEERRESADAVIARLRPGLGRIPGAALYLQPVQDLRIGGRVSAAQYQFTLQGENLEELDRWAPRVLERMRSLPGLLDVNSDQQNRGLGAMVVMDRTTAGKLGISARGIDEALYDAFGQRQVSTFYTLLNQYHVVMEVAPSYWQTPEGLGAVFFGSASEAAAPLSVFTRTRRQTTALAVSHSAQFPSVTLSFNLKEGFALGDAVGEIERVSREAGLPATIRGSFSGTAQAFQASLSDEPLLIAAALGAVFIVLGILYESTVHPITILSTLPSAGVGALLGLFVCRTELSVMSLIGIILLIGIVKKNAILMIDFALETERREGKTPEEAIFEACVLRFRPIVMTTMAALFGGLPLALGGGSGSELRRPLGIAIVGGLIFSQMLTLFTTPVVYLYLDRLRFRRSRRGPPPDPHRAEPEPSSPGP